MPVSVELKHEYFRTWPGIVKLVELVRNFFIQYFYITLPVKKYLFRNFNAHTNEDVHENHCVKRAFYEFILFFP